MKWILASERLPNKKKFYNCTFEGVPIVYWIDGENIVLHGDIMDKSIWDKIFWLDENPTASPTGRTAEEILKEKYEAFVNEKFEEHEWHSFETLKKDGISDMLIAAMEAYKNTPQQEETFELIKGVVKRIAELKPYHMNPYNLGDEGEIGSLIDTLCQMLKIPLPTAPQV